MQLPVFNVKKSGVRMLSAFGGYNHNEKIADGEFYEMQNLTTDYYPVLGTRPQRGFIRELENPAGIFGCKYLVYVDNDKLYYNEGYVCDLKEAYAGQERMFVNMGAYLCVFPDKIIYNTYTNEVEEMENTVTSTENPKFTLCKLDGTKYTDENTYTGSAEPDTETYKYWIDTSENPVVLKMWSETDSMWVSVGTTYVKVEATGIGKGFSQYDAATFKGVDTKIAAIYNDYDFNTSNVIYDAGDDYLIIVGFINKVFTNSQNITVSRTVPEMDFVAEMDNRIWGCSSENHEIYACKQGDPKNWWCYMGLVSDSYAATVGTDGDFTGCVNYQGSIMFFKDNGFHRVYGSKPSNFEIIWKPVRGVQKGSEKSLVVLNEYLYYKSREGICIYDGAVNVISDALGSMNYYEAVAGGYREKYYISMRDDDYKYSLFVYDTRKNIWIREDDTTVRGFAYANGGLYMIDDANQLMVINKEKIYQRLFPDDYSRGDQYSYPNDELYPGDSMSGELESAVEWSATTGEIGLDSPYQKYIKRLMLRLSIDKDAFFKIEVMYNSSDAWETILEYLCTRKRSYVVPIRTKRCDHMRLRFSGTGEVRLLSMAKEIEEGSAIS